MDKGIVVSLHRIYAAGGMENSKSVDTNYRGYQNSALDDGGLQWIAMAAFTWHVWVERNVR